jgi:DNA-binding NarL/FixJ family response regulator
LKSEKPVALLIGSEDRLFRECLGHRLGKETGFEVRGLADAGSVLARAGELKPDVLLLDMDSLGSVPESLLHQIRRTHPDLAILAMESRDTEHAVARLLRAGVAGFVAKREPVERLIRAVKAVALGETWAPRRATARALSGLAREQRGATVRLTPRESQLLSLLSGGYRNKELASLLGIKEQTVKMHLYRLFQKLQVKSRMAAVLAAGGRRDPT